MQIGGCRRLFGHRILSAVHSTGTMFLGCARSGLAQHAWGSRVMSFRGVKALLLTCSGIGVLLAATADANAGGLAVREQSAYGQGSSYAGVAAGGSLSSMFWNPATLTQTPGFQSESVLSGLIPSTVNTATSGTGVGTGNVAISALVPSSYYSYQFSQKLWLGLSVNAPFGLTESF